MTTAQERFVHLHVHSEYSLLDGLSRIDQLVARAKELGQPAIALTDHGAMYGVLPFYRACKAAGVKPIVGIETYLAARSMVDKDAELDKQRAHMLLLAENQTGYLNLLQIASTAQLEGFYYKPRIDREFMARHSEGLIATTGCMAAEIPRAIGAGQMDKARKLLGEYLDIFGRERLFVELQEHSIPELTEINKTLVELARSYELRLLATNDVHYTYAADADPHGVLLCIQTSSTVHEPKLKFSDKGYYLKSYAEMQAMFGELPDSLHNSLLVAEMCDLNLDYQGYHLPEFEVPAGYDVQSYLRQLCEKGLEWRYGASAAGTDEALRRRLDHELRLIHDMGFDTYFLIVWDLCQFAARSDDWWEQHRDPYPYASYEEWKKHDIWWNVRGSGAGSVVAYTLGITNLDPLKHGLIFERFLNPGRVSMPDIDLDYPDDRRSEMVEYAMRRYGHEKVAQIITFGTLGARAAIRDVGRALAMPLEEVDAIARLIPAIPGKPARIENVLDQTHEFYSSELEQEYKAKENIRTLLDTARNLEGVARHASSHAAGVVISDRPLHEYVPLNRPTSGDAGLGGIDRVTQWPMEVVDSIGLLKVDFLGLSTLTVMRLAARLIEERHGVRYDMNNIPFDVGHIGPDPAKKPEVLFDMLSQGEVSGVFQVEGAGMRRLMMDMKPRRFDHIVAAISLYRPGPMDNIPEYVRRMHMAFEGKDAARYVTPALEPILSDTYGIVVYQEQIIRIASELAGYEPGEADMIRKAVAKKKADLMEKHRLQFSEGAMARGFSREVCEAIWKDIEFFARYGFNKAHAADYAMVTCQTAFLKAHYPVEYMSALLTVERDKTDKITRYLADTRRIGIQVLAPSVNHSSLDFRIQELPATPARRAGDEPASRTPGLRFAFPVPEGAAIRFGLGAVKNVGEGPIDVILKARAQGGAFTSLEDLCERVDLRQVNKRALECLIKVGALDEFGERPKVLSVLDRMMQLSSNTWQAREVGQASLFDLFDTPARRAAPNTLLEVAPEVKPVPIRERLAWEKDLLGVYVTEHPLERVVANYQHIVTHTCADVVAENSNRRVALLGMVASSRTFVTKKKGERMAFMNLEDLHGSCEVTVFPRSYEQTPNHLLQEGAVILVRGKIETRAERVNVIADEITDNFAYAVAAREVEVGPPGYLEAELGLAMMEAELDEEDNEPEGAWREPRPDYAPAPPRAEESGRSPQPPTHASSGNGHALAAPKDRPSEDRPARAEPRLLCVRFERTGDAEQDKRRLAETVTLFRHFQGSDRFKLMVANGGELWELDFPNETTRFCPELEHGLAALLGPECLQVQSQPAGYPLSESPR